MQAKFKVGDMVIHEGETDPKAIARSKVAAAGALVNCPNSGVQVLHTARWLHMLDGDSEWSQEAHLRPWNPPYHEPCEEGFAEQFKRMIGIDREVSA